ncbi:unnamed protein product [Triticum turgidum subsp. durum]|uniref:Uncharacterized protein n=1 Tax=Triticum turgidum subsp. durum TaxID=4567 RepID=A0A9R0VU12_TRITD|nr:unnamed protein product [Triticum turgidum subsp. durum]
MEALASAPRALFARTASPTTALVTPARWTPSSSRRVKAAAAAEPAGEAKPAAAAAPPAPKKILKKKPVYSMKKGQIVRVEKEKYLNSINYLSVGHPPFYKGLDYIYEDRGEFTNRQIIKCRFWTSESLKRPESML